MDPTQLGSCETTAVHRNDSHLVTAAVATVGHLVLDAVITSVLRWTGSRRVHGNP